MLCIVVAFLYCFCCIVIRKTTCFFLLFFFIRFHTIFCHTIILFFFNTNHYSWKTTGLLPLSTFWNTASRICRSRRERSICCLQCKVTMWDQLHRIWNNTKIKRTYTMSMLVWSKLILLIGNKDQSRSNHFATKLCFSFDSCNCGQCQFLYST